MTINCCLDDIYRENIKLETARKPTEIEEFSESRRKEKMKKEKEERKKDAAQRPMCTSAQLLSCC